MACYRLINEGNWTESEEECKSHNGSLLVPIKSSMENNFVRKILVRDSERKKVWIGRPEGGYENWENDGTSLGPKCPLMNHTGKWVAQSW